MVLFLFVIMLMNARQEGVSGNKRWLTLAGTVSGGIFLLVLVAALKDSELKSRSAMVMDGQVGLIKVLGNELFTRYVVPFEISSILFLSAMVGAVVIGKKD